MADSNGIKDYIIWDKISHGNMVLKSQPKKKFDPADDIKRSFDKIFGDSFDPIENRKKWAQYILNSEDKILLSIIEEEDDNKIENEDVLTRKLSLMLPPLDKNPTLFLNDFRDILSPYNLNARSYPYSVGDADELMELAISYKADLIRIEDLQEKKKEVIDDGKDDSKEIKNEESLFNREDPKMLKEIEDEINFLTNQSQSKKMDIKRILFARPGWKFKTTLKPVTGQANELMDYVSRKANEAISKEIEELQSDTCNISVTDGDCCVTIKNQRGEKIPLTKDGRMMNHSGKTVSYILSLDDIVKRKVIKRIGCPDKYTARLFVFLQLNDRGVIEVPLPYDRRYVWRLKYLPKDGCECIYTTIKYAKTFSLPDLDNYEITLCVDTVNGCLPISNTLKSYSVIHQLKGLILKEFNSGATFPKNISPLIKINAHLKLIKTSHRLHRDVKYIINELDKTSPGERQENLQKINILLKSLKNNIGEEPMSGNFSPYSKIATEFKAIQTFLNSGDMDTVFGLKENDPTKYYSKILGLFIKLSNNTLTSLPDYFYNDMFPEFKKDFLKMFIDRADKGIGPMGKVTVRFKDEEEEEDSNDMEEFMEEQQARENKEKAKRKAEQGTDVAFTLEALKAFNKQNNTEEEEKDDDALSVGSSVSSIGTSNKLKNNTLRQQKGTRIQQLTSSFKSNTDKLFHYDPDEIWNKTFIKGKNKNYTNIKQDNQADLQERLSEIYSPGTYVIVESRGYIYGTHIVESPVYDTNENGFFCKVFYSPNLDIRVDVNKIREGIFNTAAVQEIGEYTFSYSLKPSGIQLGDRNVYPLFAPGSVLLDTENNFDSVTVKQINITTLDDVNRRSFYKMVKTSDNEILLKLKNDSSHETLSLSVLSSPVKITHITYQVDDDGLEHSFMNLVSGGPKNQDFYGGLPKRFIGSGVQKEETKEPEPLLKKLAKIVNYQESTDSEKYEFSEEDLGHSSSNGGWVSMSVPCAVEIAESAESDWGEENAAWATSSNGSAPKAAWATSSGGEMEAQAMWATSSSDEGLKAAWATESSDEQKSWGGSDNDMSDVDDLKSLVQSFQQNSNMASWAESDEEF